MQQWRLQVGGVKADLPACAVSHLLFRSPGFVRTYTLSGYRHRYEHAHCQDKHMQARAYTLSELVGAVKRMQLHFSTGGVKEKDVH